MSIKAGSNMRIKIAGNSLSATSEAMEVVSGKRYKLTDRSKVIWDREVVPTFYDDGTPVIVTNILSILYLTGQVIFVSTYTPTGVITADFSYKPSSIITWLKDAELNESVDLEDKTNFCTTYEDIINTLTPSRRKLTNLAMAEGSLNGFYDNIDNLFDVLKSGENLIIEFQPDKDDDTDIVYVESKLSDGNKAFNIEEVNTASVNFQSTYPVEYEPE